VDFKYNLFPNILWAKPNSCSPFWKGVIWAAEAATMGYTWKLGNGNKVLFWSDVWFGSCSFAFLYWDLYNIVNEPQLIVSQAWDGEN
jgi:hypothetical protein